MFKPYSLSFSLPHFLIRNFQLSQACLSLVSYTAQHFFPLAFVLSSNHLEIDTLMLLSWLADLFDAENPLTWKPWRALGHLLSASRGFFRDIHLRRLWPVR